MKNENRQAPGNENALETTKKQRTGYAQLLDGSSEIWSKSRRRNITYEKRYETRVYTQYDTIKHDTLKRNIDGRYTQI